MRRSTWGGSVRAELDSKPQQFVVVSHEWVQADYNPDVGDVEVEYEEG